MRVSHGAGAKKRGFVPAARRCGAAGFQHRSGRHAGDEGLHGLADHLRLAGEVG
jgi:hypothetical protein